MRGALVEALIRRGDSVAVSVECYSLEHNWINDGLVHRKRRVRVYKRLNIMVILVSFLTTVLNVKAEEIDLSEISISANRVATPLADVGSSVTVLSQEDISISPESFAPLL